MTSVPSIFLETVSVNEQTEQNSLMQQRLHKEHQLTVKPF